MDWLVSSNIHLQKMCHLWSGWLEHRQALATVFAVTAQFFWLPLEGVGISAPELASKSNTHSRVMNTCEIPGISSILLWLWLKYLWKKKKSKQAGWVFCCFFRGHRCKCTLNFQLKLRSYCMCFFFFWWSKVKADMTSGGVDQYTQQRAPATDYLNQLCWLYWSTVPLCWYVRNPSSLN